jgi:hypothetical protein
LAEYLLHRDVPVHTAATSDEAAEILERVRVRTVFYSGSRQAPEIGWLHSSVPEGAQRPRLVVLLSRPNAVLADQYRELGADIVLIMPVTPEKIVAAGAFTYPVNPARIGAGVPPPAADPVEMAASAPYRQS